jgi:hypothetical protein
MMMASQIHRKAAEVFGVCRQTAATPAGDSFGASIFELYISPGYQTEGWWRLAIFMALSTEQPKLATEGDPRVSSPSTYR